MIAYNWYIFDSRKVFNEAIRQGVVTANSEDDAKAYLLATFNSEENQMLRSKKNVLVVTMIYSWEI
jgi:hypothetical protein